MNDRVRKVVILVVTLVWAANFLAPLWIKDFKPPVELNVAFMGIIGYLTAGGRGNSTSTQGESEIPPGNESRRQDDPTREATTQSQ